MFLREDTIKVKDGMPYLVEYNSVYYNKCKLKIDNKEMEL